MSEVETTTMRCDLLIVGGSLEGCVAAIRAARHGQNVYLVEKSGALGGMSSNGLAAWMGPNNGSDNSLRTELLMRLGCVDGPEGALYPDQRMKVVLGEMLRASGVHWLTHVFLSEPLLQGSALLGFTVNGKTGPIHIEAPRIIDATDTMETAAMLQLPWTNSHGKVSVSIKCNGFESSSLPLSIVAHPTGGIVADLAVSFRTEQANCASHCESLRLLMRDTCNEALISGLQYDLSTLDAFSLSAAQLDLSRFAYALRDKLRQSIPGMSGLNIIHVAPRMDAYGLLRCDNPWANLLLLNNDGKPYANVTAIEKGGNAVS